MANVNKPQKSGEKPKRERIVDARAEILRSNKFFPKQNYAKVIHYFAPEIPIKRIYDAFTGGTVSEELFLSVMQVTETVLDFRKQYEVKRAEERAKELEQKARAIREGAAV